MKYRYVRFAGGFIHGDFEDDRDLDVDEVDEISRELVGEDGDTAPVCLYAGDTKMWSYDDTRGIDLSAKYQEFHKMFAENLQRDLQRESEKEQAFSPIPDEEIPF